MLCDARIHCSHEGEHCGSTEIASSTYIRKKYGTVTHPTVPRGNPVPRGQGNGRFLFYRRAYLHVIVNRPAVVSDDSNAQRRVDVGVFTGDRKQTPHLWAVSVAIIKASVDYNHIMESVSQ